MARPSASDSLSASEALDTELPPLPEPESELLFRKRDWEREAPLAWGRVRVRN
jgi:hypothetical protein